MNRNNLMSRIGAVRRAKLRDYGAKDKDVEKAEKFQHGGRIKNVDMAGLSPARRLDRRAHFSRGGETGVADGDVGGVGTGSVASDPGDAPGDDGGSAGAAAGAAGGAAGGGASAGAAGDGAGDAGGGASAGTGGDGAGGAGGDSGGGGGGGGDSGGGDGGGGAGGGGDGGGGEWRGGRQERRR